MVRALGGIPESHPLSLRAGFGDAVPPFARDVAGLCDATLARRSPDEKRGGLEPLSAAAACYRWP